MKYWLSLLLLCAGAAQAHAQVITVNSGPVSFTGGVKFGNHNTTNIQQHNAVNVAAVQTVSLVPPGGTSTTHNNVDQTGVKNYSYLGTTVVGVPANAPLGAFGGP